MLKSIKKADVRNAASQALQGWLADNDVQRRLDVNRYQGVLWFNKEALEEWLWWMFIVQAVQAAAELETGEAIEVHLLACHAVILQLQEAESQSGYQVEKLIEAIGQPDVSNSEKQKERS